MEEIYSLTREESNRFSDIKLVSMLLVVLIHMSSGTGMSTVADFVIWVIAQIVARSAVPCFFVLSAILLYRKKFKWTDNIKKKFKTLVIPFVFWNSLWLVFFWVAQKIPQLDMFFSNPENRVGDFSFWDWVDAYLAIFERSKPFVYPLWFIKDLFVLNLLSHVIKKIADRIPKITLIIVLAMYFCRINLRFIETQSILFFLLGYYVVKYNVRIETINQKIRSIHIIEYGIAVLLLAILEFFFQSDIYIIHESVIICGVFIMFSKVNIMNHLHSKKQKRVLKYCEAKTFFVFCAHEWTLLFLRKLVEKIVPYSQGFVLLSFFAIPVLVCFGLIILGGAIEKVSPDLYNIITGSRRAS